jgi:hypothetical protein
LACLKANAPATPGRKQALKTPAPLPNAARDTWVAKQRAKKNPPSWKEIYDEGLSLSSRRGWDMPGSPKALEEANRRYNRRQRLAAKK